MLSAANTLGSCISEERSDEESKVPDAELSRQLQDGLILNISLMLQSLDPSSASGGLRVTSCELLRCPKLLQ